MAERAPSAPFASQVWRFARGETGPRDFEAWVCSSAESVSALGEPLFSEVIAADYRDACAVALLRERLFDWALLSRAPGCPLLDYVRLHAIRFDEMPICDLGNGSMRRLIPIGFWRSDDSRELPHPRDMVDPEWDLTERDRVAAYLDAAYVLRGYLGFSWCRMGCPGVPADIGSRDLTDGTWVFPEGLTHYVRHHSVKPAREFLDHISQSSYRMPALSLVRAHR